MNPLNYRVFQLNVPLLVANQGLMSSWVSELPKLPVAFIRCTSTSPKARINVVLSVGIPQTTVWKSQLYRDMDSSAHFNPKEDKDKKKNILII